MTVVYQSLVGLLLLTITLAGMPLRAEESLPPLKDGRAPGSYEGVYTAKTVNISSTMAIVTPQQLTAAGVKAMLKPSLLIESFGKGWQKEWFTYDLSGNWARNTHKVYDPQYRAPAGAKLSLEVRAEQPNKLVIGLDGYAAEVALRGGSEWQTVILTAAWLQAAEDNPVFKSVKYGIFAHHAWGGTAYALTSGSPASS